MMQSEFALLKQTRKNYLMILDGAAAKASDDLLGRDTLVLVDAELTPRPPIGDFTVRSFPFTETARKLGARRVANIVALGALASLSGVCAQASLETAVRAGTPKKFARMNMEALEAGRAMIAS